MEISIHNPLSPHDLGKRWNRSEMAIRLASAVGVGPRYVTVGGELRYPVDEVQKYERACGAAQPATITLSFNPPPTHTLP